MPISFGCVCGKQLKVAEEYAGKRAKCPDCAGVVTVPLPPKPELSVEDAAFEMLTPDEPDPAPRPVSVVSQSTIKHQPRQWEDDADETPYRLNSASEAPQSPSKPVRSIPKFQSKKIRRREERDRERTRVSISPAVIMSIAGIVVFGGLNALTLANGWFSIWLVVLFGGSVLNLIRGLLGLSED